MWPAVRSCLVWFGLVNCRCVLSAPYSVIKTILSMCFAPPPRWLNYAIMVERDYCKQDSVGCAQTRSSEASYYNRLGNFLGKILRSRASWFHPSFCPGTVAYVFPPFCQGLRFYNKVDYSSSLEKLVSDKHVLSMPERVKSKIDGSSIGRGDKQSLFEK